MSNLPWTHISDAYAQGLRYIKDRQTGVVKSIKTPWSKINESTMDGLEWNTISVIGGRPGGGKTLMLNQLTRSAFALNPDQDFCVLDFQLEMIERTTAIREFSGVFGKSLKQLCSADGQIITDDEIEAVRQYCAANKHRNIFQVTKPVTVEQFKYIILRFLETYKKPTIVTLDHSVLIRKDAGFKDNLEMLGELGNTLTELKSLNVMFIILSQLNRGVESEARLKEGSNGNYLLDSDIYGADALLQHTDLLIGVNRPAKYGLRYYGAPKFIVTPNLLAIHIMKSRSGGQSLCFFEAEFENMRVREIGIPPTKQ